MKLVAKILRDFLLMTGSVAAAVLLVKFGMVDWIIHISRDFGFLAAFIGGLFYVSVFTAAPAVALFAELSPTISPFTIAIFGAFGSLLGDLVILYFFREKLADNIELWTEKISGRGFFSVFKNKYASWLGVILGSLVIASPLPDELGIAIVGISKIRIRVFAPLSFILNGIGILIIALAAQAV